MNKPFLYLIQAGGALPPHYSSISGDRADTEVLTWRDPIPGCHHRPGTTWSAGRNALLAAVKSKLDRYSYVVFLDDDIEFRRGSWRDFEDWILRFRPAVASPHLVDYPAQVDKRCDVQTMYAFDACYNAFRTDVVRSGWLVPYEERFDGISWWYSQYVLIHKAQARFASAAYQFNRVEIRNLRHGEYPRDVQFSHARRVERWLLTRVLPRHPAFLWRFRPYGPDWFQFKPQSVPMVAPVR